MFVHVANFWRATSSYSKCSRKKKCNVNVLNAFKSFVAGCFLGQGHCAEEAREIKDSSLPE